MLSIVMKGINDFMSRKEDLEKGFLRGELSDYAVYTALAGEERNQELRRVLQSLAGEEKGHIGIWRSLLGGKGERVRGPLLMWPRVLFYRLVRRVFGIAFTVRLLELNEAEGLRKYEEALRGAGYSEGERKYARMIIGEETGHEEVLSRSVSKYEGDLNYIESTILGLNDGLVEILAVIAGIATVSTTSLIVVIIGMIAGISGTLSMAGGVYLSAKSENLVKVAKDGKGVSDGRPSPRIAAYHTGAYYFIGALIAVLPFLFGLQGILGIVSSILLVSASLVTASAIVAITSGTSIRQRAVEMLAISLSAAFVTILFGTFARLYFGVSI
jgi:VIT1/CCC1 family predicted Fe2+/Mn2+ transporter